ncbi:MAG: alkaline phosphatase family protein [Bacteroidetes bacterium]|nr:alkaline phosphatase family protein [Bacteroidota bacterium]MBS1930211.1 alkaline phosphatase family protein [Bacteroidota bacterium]
MKKVIITELALLITFYSFSQTIIRPKLVVGIVVDQMRWDYLYRYTDRYAPNGGFKRLLGNGFTCENTFIPYSPTITACGHTCVYTGSVPAIHGITENNWWDNLENRLVYCTEDNTVTPVGTTSNNGKMSPHNLLVTTIGDELRLATNFRSKVIGIALKDRASILPAGHSPNAAYWYDATSGNWVSSSYYMNDLPQWVKDLNAKKLPDQYFTQGWNTLYPIETYKQSTADDVPFESHPFGKSFPYDLKKFIGKNYGMLDVTPQGNTFTVEMAKAAIINEQLGADDITDMLTISFSATDYIGHTFGPNSIEQEDDFLRLDKDLGDLLDFLDTKVGVNQYTVFLTADHGVAHVPGFMEQHKIPAGSFNMAGTVKALNELLNNKYGKNNLVAGGYNEFQITLNHQSIDSAKMNAEDIKKIIIEYLVARPGVSRAFALDNITSVPLNARIKEMIINGYFPKRSGDIEVILDPQWLAGFSIAGTSHGMWNPYDSHIPLVWYGWGIKQGSLHKETYMTDIAATVAALLHIQMPNGCIGHVITDALYVQ